MGAWKRSLSVLLAVTMCMGIFPVNAYATPVIQQTEDGAAAGDRGGQKQEIPEADTQEESEPVTETVLENSSAEEGVLPGQKQQRASDSTGSPIEESFITMTEGQKLLQTVKEKQYYIFAPKESGWYYLKMESPKKGDCFTAGVYQTIYYEGEEQKKKTYREDLYRIRNSSSSDYIMWLNKAEKYVFHCSITNYTDSSDMKVWLTIKRAGDWRLETLEPPAEPSDFGFVGTGMKVAFYYGDGTSYTEPVRCTVTDDGGWNRQTSNMLEALRWSGIAVSKGESLSEYLQVLRVDENEQVDFAALPEGSHRAALGIRRSASGQNSYLELETGFEVSHNPVESISVISCQDIYEQDMEQYLGNITIKAVRKDGQTEELSSNNAYIYQSLPCEEEEGGPAYGLTSIDEYLKGGGSLGEAEVTVEYQGKKTAYPIEIKEYPYNGMSVSPKKRVYYANSGYQDSDRNLRYPGDAISIQDVYQVLMSRKDGGTDPYYVSGSQFYGLPYAHKLSFGMELNGNSYKDIDTYLGDGGSYGEHEVKVSYMDFETSYTVDIRQNPYVRMEISKLPKTLTYPYNTTRINLSGLEIRAYKNETEYDTYTYGQDAPEGAAVSTWRNYFRSYPKTDEYPYGFSAGEHTVYITFLNMRAEFKIQIEEREPDSPSPVYVDMKILKEPARTLYYIKENEHLNDCLSADGLEIELTDSKGETKKYKYNDNSGKEFAPWSEISPYIAFDWKRIDWSSPGSYVVSVFCQENCAEFDVAIADSPVSSFEVLRMPETDTYYFYENKTMSSSGLLRGLAYQVTFDDGSIHAATVKGNFADGELEVSFQGRAYKINLAWLRSTSNGTASVGENAIVFTLFGKQYQAGPITILENPLESLEVVKAPDDLLCIGQNAQPDLYGAKFKITYTGGRTREVEVHEHTSSVLVEEDARAITSQVATELDPDEAGSIGRSRRYIRFTYFDKTAQVPADIKPQDLEPKPLRNNGQAAAVLDGDHPYQVYSFTPEKEGVYSFFCVEKEYRDYNFNHNFYVSLFDGDQSLFEMTVGDWGIPMQAVEPLKPGHTYYYIVSIRGGADRAQIPYECYISSDILNDQHLGSPAVEVVDTKKKVWYEYEMANSWLRPSMSGTTLKLTYPNGWTEEKYVSEYSMNITIAGKSYNVDWKYLDPQEPWNQKPQLRDDNALVYTYTQMGGAADPGDPADRVIKEIPIRLNAPNPIESLSIDVNPFEGCYEYSLENTNPAGLVVTAHFKEESRPDETFVWDGSSRQEIDGCQLIYEGVFQTGQTGEHGGRMYRLKVSCMDVTKEVLFEVMPNPVTGFELVTQPQKRTYYPFERSGDLDLYGMEYAVVYRDGTKENVTMTEHSSYPKAPEGGGGELNRFYKAKVREDGVTVTELYFSYQGCEQKVTEFEELPFSQDQAAELSDTRANDMVLGYGSNYYIYKFISQETNHYKLNVSGNVNFEIYLYDVNGEQQARTDARRSGKRYLGNMEWDMGAQDMVYVVFQSKEAPYIGSLRASLAGEAIEKEELEEIGLTVDAPAAGEPLPDTGQPSMEGYRIASSQWYGDADADGCADFAVAHRLMLVLSAEPRYRFTEKTKVTLNGTELTDCILGADGSLTLYYTFPYTECKIGLPDVDGYTLDTYGNVKEDRVAYGGTYRFRYLDEEGRPDQALSVKANGNIVDLDAEGYYTLTNVTENISVTVRPDIGDIEPGEGESKVTMHNQSEERYDVMLGKKGQSVKDNPEGQNTLPLLPSYENGSDDFFYGWYTGKDENFNGKGTRFTSMTILDEDAYELFAKWGSGIFEQRQGKRNAIYRVLSFDEYNHMKVEIKGIRRYELYPQTKTAARSVKAAEGQLAQSTKAAGAKEGGNADGEDESFRLEIPAALTQDQMQLQEGLELSIEGCEVVSVAESAFEDCKDLTEIKLPDGITEIGSRAFAGCDSLEKIVLPGTLEKTGERLFDGCDGITVVLPDTIEGINSGAFDGAENLTIICSSKLKESGILDKIQEEGVTVQVVDLIFDCENGEKVFSYGAGEECLTAKVLINGVEAEENRPLLWQYEQTDAYTYRVDGNALAVTPNRVTTPEDEVQVIVIDEETGARAALALHTVPADLGGANESGEAIFDVQISGRLVYDGKEQRPGVTVYRRMGSGSRLDSSEYDVSYTDNINAGTGLVTVTGKGNYTGSITKGFEIGKAEQVVIAFDLEKTTDDLIFPLNAKASGNGKLHYSSNNPAVAVIDGHGIVMIRGAGTAEIGVWASETANYRDSALKIVTLVVKQAGILPPGPVEGPDQGQTGTNQPPQTGTQGDSSNTSGGGTATTSLAVAQTSYTKALGSKPFVIGALADTAIRFMTSSPKVASVDASGKVTLHKCGRAIVTVTAGDAQVQVTIRVVPKKAKAKVTVKKGGEMAVSWKRQKEAKGYVIEYSTDKNFKKNVSKKVIKNNKTTKATLKKLKEGKKYYVRVKAYTVIGGKKVYGARSKAVNAKA